MARHIETPTYKYMSYGAGVQSTAMLGMSALGLYNVPRVDLAIFSDTQREPQWVYDTMTHMQEWLKPHGIKLITATAGDIGQKIFDRIDGKVKSAPAIPAFVKNADGTTGILRRHCTRDYKIRPIERALREFMGYGPRKQKKDETAWGLIGISIDEVERMKDNPTPWIENKFPLIDARINREDCVRIIEEMGLPRPLKSSCYFCPYHSNHYWRSMQNEFPEEFQKCIDFDERIRNMKNAGVEGQVFLHPSCVPLSEADFTGKKNDIDGQFDMFPDMFKNDCEGMCGV